MADIALSAGMRKNLITLQNTSSLLDRTQERLSSGKKVNSPVDNPTNYFAATGLEDRSTDLTLRLDAMGQAIQTVKATDNGLTAIRGVLSQLKGVVNDALSESDTNNRRDLGKQFNELLRQVNTIAKDSSYAGINFLKEDTSNQPQEFTVQFNERINQSTLVMTGFHIDASTNQLNANGEISASAITDTSGDSTFALALRLNGKQTLDADDTVVGIKAHGTDDTAATEHEVDWGDNATYKTNLSNIISNIEAFDEVLKIESKKLANNLNVVSLRESFTKEMANSLQEGADKLTLADLNEEGANLLALQTSQQLGINSLALASQSQQAVLRLVQ